MQKLGKAKCLCAFFIAISSCCNLRNIHVTTRKRKTAKKTRIMSKLAGDGEFQNVSLPGTLPGVQFSAPEDFQLFQSSESAFNQIIEALKNDETHIIGLFGMGGVGKTMLTKAVGNKVNKEIFDEAVMVFISQTPD